MGPRAVKYGQAVYLHQRSTLYSSKGGLLTVVLINLQILKAVNEVYKSFNTNQHPLAILDFEIPRESVDINVSPDKRTIFVHSEANLIEALKVRSVLTFKANPPECLGDLLPTHKIHIRCSWGFDHSQVLTERGRR
jgi:DNA mismatch repair ATPase MutL